MKDRTMNTRIVLLIAAGAALAACARQEAATTSAVAAEAPTAAAPATTVIKSAPTTETPTTEPVTLLTQVAVYNSECGWLNEADVRFDVYDATNLASTIDPTVYPDDPFGTALIFADNADIMGRAAVLLTPHTDWPMVARIQSALADSALAYANAAVAATIYDLPSLQAAVYDLGDATNRVGVISGQIDVCLS